MINLNNDYKKNFNSRQGEFQVFLQKPSTSSSCRIKGMSESIGKRIEIRRIESGLSQTDLGKKLSVTPQSVQQWESDKTSPRGKRLDLLSEALLCSKEWLVFGNKEANGVEKTRFSNIPVLDVELAAGFGTHIETESVTSHIPIAQDWITDNNLNTASLAAVMVSGDSMSPRIMSGDMLLIDTSDRLPASGKVYAIATEDDLRVKRLMRRTDGSWVISSDNKHDPAFQDEIISHHNFERLRIIGRAVRVLMGSI